MTERLNYVPTSSAPLDPMAARFATAPVNGQIYQSTQGNTVLNFNTGNVFSLNLATPNPNTDPGALNIDPYGLLDQPNGRFKLKEPGLYLVTATVLVGVTAGAAWGYECLFFLAPGLTASPDQFSLQTSGFIPINAYSTQLTLTVADTFYASRSFINTNNFLVPTLYMYYNGGAGIPPNGSAIVIKYASNMISKNWPSKY